METLSEHRNGGSVSERHQLEPKVSVTIGECRELTRGRHSVADIKKKGEIPLAFELDEVICGKLTPLPDDGFVELKGGEMFVGHPRSSCSS